MSNKWIKILNRLKIDPWPLEKVYLDIFKNPLYSNIVSYNFLHKI